MSGLWRAFGRGLVVVQAMVAFALPVADAASVHAPVVAHWEDASDTACPPQHDQSTCATCQLVRLPGNVPAQAPHVPLAGGAASVPPAGPDARYLGEPSIGFAPSRAPPEA